MTKTRPVAGLSDSQVLKRLETCRNAVRDAEADLEDLLLELHDDRDRWDRMTYAQLASALGVSRQAVSQRVQRLLHRGAARRANALGSDPNQLTIGDA